MRNYSNIISLSRNSRGVYCLDTSIGCSSGMAETVAGCYGDCYAAKASRRYGYDFSKTIFRHFESRQHAREITLRISKIKMPFVRIGCSGDPSEDWGHTLNIVNEISGCNKEIVIITRHWTLLTDEQLKMLSRFNICINSSVSALDKPDLREKCVSQYHRVKPFCKSVLRIISCDFNMNNSAGKMLSVIQHQLFKNDSTIDTVFRPDKNNRFITEGIINVKKARFMNSQILVSRFNRKTFLGNCQGCKEMCGASLKMEVPDNPGRRKLVKQLSLI